MNCYPCLQAGITREAAGLCHHCSAALCADHICAVDEPRMVKHVMAPCTILPKKARLLLCATCKGAFAQFQAEPEGMVSIVERR